MIAVVHEAWSRAIAAASTASPDECIPWEGARTWDGYGRGSRRRLAHRAVFEAIHGPFEGLLDHTCHDPASCSGGPGCRHRACVNPHHLAVASFAENVLRGCGPTAINARKTHCNRGHEFTPANTYITSTGGRRCRACAVLATRRYLARKAIAS